MEAAGRGGAEAAAAAGRARTQAGQGRAGRRRCRALRVCYFDSGCGAERHASTGVRRQTASARDRHQAQQGRRRAARTASTQRSPAAAALFTEWNCSAAAATAAAAAAVSEATRAVDGRVVLLYVGRYTGVPRVPVHVRVRVKTTPENAANVAARRIYRDLPPIVGDAGRRAMGGAGGGKREAGGGVAGWRKKWRGGRLFIV